MRLVPEAVFSENDFIQGISDVYILHRKSLIKDYKGFPIDRNHSTGTCSTGLYSVFHTYRFEIGAGTN